MLTHSRKQGFHFADLPDDEGFERVEIGRVMTNILRTDGSSPNASSP